jgi:hypothetical protein
MYVKCVCLCHALLCVILFKLLVRTFPLPTLYELQFPDFALLQNLCFAYFHPQSNESVLREPDEIVESRSQKRGSGFWNSHFSNYRSAVHRFMIWMLHICVFVYVISAIIFWKYKGKKI